MSSQRSPLTDIFPSLANEFDEQRKILETKNGRTSVVNKSPEIQNAVKKATRPFVPADQQNIGPPSRYNRAMSLQPVVNETRPPNPKGFLSTGDRNVSRKSVATSGEAKHSGALYKRRSMPYIGKLAEDLRELQHLKIQGDKPDVEKIQEEMKSEYKIKRYFETHFRQIRTDSISPKEVFQFPKMFPLASATKEYRPLEAVDLKEKWHVERSGHGKGEIRSIRGICFPDPNHLAITEAKNSRVQIFSVADGKSQRILSDMTAGRRPMQPAGICTIPDSRLLAVADLDRLQFIDPSYRGEWSSELAIPNKLRLTGVASTTRGELVLTDTGVKPSAGLFEINGKVIREFKVEWRRPVAVTISCELGITFVADSDAGCVYMFDQYGTLLSKLGSTGNEDTRLVHPSGLCCLSMGTCLLVSDRVNHRVLVYDIRNRAVDHLLTAKDGIISPVCLASSEDRHLALSEETFDFKSNSYKLKLFSAKMSTGNK